MLAMSRSRNGFSSSDSATLLSATAGAGSVAV